MLFGAHELWAGDNNVVVYYPSGCYYVLNLKSAPTKLFSLSTLNVMGAEAAVHHDSGRSLRRQLCINKVAEKSDGKIK